MPDKCGSQRVHWHAFICVLTKALFGEECSEVIFLIWADDSPMLHLCMYVPVCTVTEGKSGWKSMQKDQKERKSNINMAVLGIWKHKFLYLFFRFLSSRGLVLEFYPPSWDVNVTFLIS